MDKEDKIKEKNLIINFLFDFLSMFLENNPNMKIVPGFHHQDRGITIKVLQDKIILNNVFGFNNGLSKEEQEFFLKSFQNFNNYNDLLHSNFGRILSNTTKIKN